MSSQNIRLEFSDLKNLSEDELDMLPSNKLLQICIDALLGNKYDDNSVINFTLKKISIHTRIQETTTHYLQTFTKYLLDSVSKILTLFDTSLDADSLNKLLLITLNLTELTTSLSNTDQQVPASNIYVILGADLKIVKEHYVFFQNSNKRLTSVSQQCNELLNKLFNNCQMLQSLVVNFVINHIEYFTYSHEIDCSHVNNVVQSLCSVGEFVALVDVKSTADIWKCISRLGSENCNFVKTQNTSISWLENAIEFLCNEIVQSVEIILDNMKEVDSQFLAKLERILKINSFYLKIIIKFATDFGCHHFQGHEHVVNLSIALNSLPAKAEESKVGESIRQYLTVGVSNLVGELYKSPDFEKAFSNHDFSDAQTFKAYCLLWNEVVEFVIESGDVLVAAIYLHEKETNIFGRILHATGLYPTVILKPDIYESLITTTAAAILSSSGLAHVLKYFENTLLNGILGGCILQNFICCDIMCILFRFANEETRRNYFKFYMRLALNSPLFSFQANLLFVKCLLQSFYTILSDNQKKISIAEILNENASSATAVKVAFIINGATKERIGGLENIADTCGGRLNSIVPNFLRTPTAESYYELAKCLTLSRSESMNPALKNQIEKLWIQSLTAEKFSNSIVLSQSLGNFLRRSPASVELVNKLLDITNCQSLRKVDKLNIIKVLVHCVENNMINNEIKSKMVTSLIADDPICPLYIIHYQRINLLPVNILSRIPRVDAERKDSYILKLASKKFEHSCSKHVQADLKQSHDDCTDLNPPKRLRPIGTCCSLLSKAKCIAEEVSRYFENDECCGEDVDCINDIISIYSAVVRDVNK